MNEYISVPLIVILGTVSTFLTSQDPLYSKSPKFRFTKTGYLVSCIGFITLLISTWQLYSTSRRNKEEEVTRLKSTIERDSIITQRVNLGVEQNRKQLFADLSTALKKQDLHLDTVSKAIVALRDSAKTIVIKHPNHYPILMIYNGGISHKFKNDTIEFNIALTSNEAPANVVFIDQITKLNFFDGSNEKLKKIRLYEGPVTIPANQTLNKRFFIVPSKAVKDIEILFYGKFSDIDNKKASIFDMVYEYDLSSQLSGYKTIHARDSLKNLYKVKW